MDVSINIIKNEGTQVKYILFIDYEIANHNYPSLTKKLPNLCKQKKMEQWRLENPKYI